MSTEKDYFEKAFEPFMQALKEGDWSEEARLGVKASNEVMRAKGVLELTDKEKAARCPYKLEPRQGSRFLLVFPRR